MPTNEKIVPPLVHRDMKDTGQSRFNEETVAVLRRIVKSLDDILARLTAAGI